MEAQGSLSLRSTRAARAHLPETASSSTSSPGIEEIKEYCAEQVDTLWDEVKRFDNPHNYYVDLSQKLYDIKTELLNEKNERYEKN